MASSSSHPPPPKKLHNSISDLPVNVVDDILIRIPLKEAIRTSILSSSWKHSWKSIHSLHFDHHHRDYENDDETNFDIPLAAVNAVLRIRIPRSEPISSFSLFNRNVNVSDTHWWLISLSLAHRESLTTLILGFFPIQQQPLLDSSLATFLNLKKLSLINCSIPLLSYNFPNLHKLLLTNVGFPDAQSVNDLLSRCPVLVSLIISNAVPCPQNFVITNPKLCYVIASRLNCSLITFASCQVLNTVQISLTPQAESYDLAHSFPAGGAICNGSLNLCYTTVRAITRHGVPERIHDCFRNLVFLDIHVDFSYMDKIMLLVCLMRSAPGLQKIRIFGSINDDENEEIPNGFWEQHIVGGELENLQIVKLNLLVFLDAEISFMVHLLKTAKQLKKLKVTTSSQSGHEALKNSTLQLLRSCEKASAQVDIV